MSRRDTRRRSRRLKTSLFRRLGLLAGVCLLLSLPLAWFAPSIIAGTDLRQRILPAILPDFAGTFQLGSARLSWFAPVELHDVSAIDAAGETLLTAATIRTEKNLLSLITAPHQVGMVTIEQPHADIQLTPTGSNLETAMAPLLVTDPAARRVSFTLVISSGTAEIHDTVTNVRSEIGQLTATVTTPRVDRPLRIQAAGQLVTLEQSGSFDADFTWADAANGGASKVLLETETLPLAVMSALLRRQLPQAEITGQLTSDVDLAVTAAGDAFTIDGEIEAPTLQLTAPTLIGSDVLSLTAAKYRGTTAIEAEQITFAEATLISSLGSVAADGTMPLTQLKKANWTAALRDVAAHDVRAAGNVDLATLAAMLPGVLRIRDGVQVTQGTLGFDVGVATDVTQPQPDSPDVKPSTRTASVTVSDLKAQRGQQFFAWTQPIQLKLAANVAGDRPQLESATCRSQHLTANIRRRDDGFDVNAQADLNHLAAQLSQVIDLGGIEMAGRGEIRAFVNRTDQQQLAASGAVTLEQFLVRIPGYQPWQEDRLNATGEASGDWPTDQPPTINVAQLQLTSGEDVLVAELLQPVVVQDVATCSWPAQVEVRGDLSRWHARLAPLLPANHWHITGGLNGAAKGMFSSRYVSITSSDVQLTQLDVRQVDPKNPSRVLRHYAYPQAQLQTAGHWDLTQQRGEASVLTLATPAWSLRGSDLAMQLVEKGLPQVAGEFAFRSDLGRTLAVVRSPQQPLGVDLQGAAVGTITLRHAQGITSASWNATVDNLLVTGPSEAAAQLAADPQRVAIHGTRQTLWQEPQLTLAGQATYTHEVDKLSLAQVDAAGTTASVKMIGVLSAVTTGDPQVDLSGTATYDLAALTPRLQPWLGSQVQLTGQRTGTFALKGPVPQFFSEGSPQDSLAGVRVISSIKKVNELTPLVPMKLTGNVTGGWTTATAYGVTLGEANVAAELKESIVRVQPLDMAVGQGRLKLAPWVYLDRTPGIVALQEGPLLENVDLTREMCHSWLKYVAPVLADATRCEGKISAHVTQAQMPLGSPSQLTAAGTLTIHGGQVMTGPLAEQYIALARQIQSLVKGQLGAGTGGEVSLVNLGEQTIDVQASEGRVHHRGLKLQIGQVLVETSGSVGFDQTLNLIATVAIDPSWVAGKPVLASLAGQTIQVPITGTVGKPRLDSSGIQGLSQQLIRGAAGNLLQGEVNKLLEGFLPTP